MWQRFSERARKVVFAAQEEAQRQGDGYISTEHFLLGLLREPCTATELIEKLGFDPAALCGQVKRHMLRGDHFSDRHISITPRGKRVIDFAYDEARRLSHTYIGTEHLLLGLMREEEGIAGRVLLRAGLTVSAVESVIRSSPGIKNESASSPMPPPVESHKVSPTWRQGASHLYLIQRPNTRALLVVLAGLMDSFDAQQSLKENGVDPLETIARLESLVINRAVEFVGPVIRMNELLAYAQKLSADSVYDSGYLFFAALGLDESLLEPLHMTTDSSLRALLTLQKLTRDVRDS